MSMVEREKYSRSRAWNEECEAGGPGKEIPLWEKGGGKGVSVFKEKGVSVFK